MDWSEQRIKTFISEYIKTNSSKFQNSFPHDNEKFHIIGGLKSEIDTHNSPLLLQGRLPEILEYVTFELDDFLNLHNNIMYKDSTGRIDLYKFVEKPFLQQELLKQGLSVNLENKFKTISNKSNFDEFQTPTGLIKHLESYETPSLRNIFLDSHRYT